MLRCGALKEHLYLFRVVLRAKIPNDWLTHLLFRSEFRYGPIKTSMASMNLSRLIILHNLKHESNELLPDSLVKLT